MELVLAAIRMDVGWTVVDNLAIRNVRPVMIFSQHQGSEKNEIFQHTFLLNK
jgi:hypothetical protein